MAIADWLNPATPQPTYLTSRAAGVVVPEFYRAASETRKNALSLAGQEQGLLLNEEQNLRARDAEARRKAEEAAAAALMPRLTQLDPTKPDYFTNLSRIMAEPGAANALASQQVRSFLDLAGGARSEQIRTSEQAARDKLNLEEEQRRRQDQIDSEERAAARRNLEDTERLALKAADELEDDQFMAEFNPQFEAIRKEREANPSKVPAGLAKLTEDITRKRAQGLRKKKLLGFGVTPEEIGALKKKDGGKFGDYTDAKLGMLEQQATPTARMNAQLRSINERLESRTLSKEERTKLEAERDRLYSGSVNPVDEVADYIKSLRLGGTGGAPARKE
jgi:hypothetical protein